MAKNHVETRKLSETFGAEILNVNLAAEQPDATWEEIRKLSSEYGLIIFRDQDITPRQHIDFSHRLGEVIVGVTNTPPHPDYPEILEVRKEPEQKSNVGGSWHTDQSYREAPVRQTTLLARDIPVYGGDTMFLSMAAVYNSLSDGLKNTIKDLKVIHSNGRALASRLKGDSAIVDRNRPVIEVTHPMVVTHPVSKQKILYVNPGHTVRIDGWNQAESDGFLNMLYELAKKPEIQYRLNWKVGTLAIWDNISTWHYALNDYQGMRRVMHRTWVGRDKLN